MCESNGGTKSIGRIMGWGFLSMERGTRKFQVVLRNEAAARERGGGVKVKADSTREGEIS